MTAAPPAADGGGQTDPAPSEAAGVAAEVLVVGDLMVDIVIAHARPIAVGSDSAARISLRGGGSAANTACWLARLGVPTDLLAARGDDDLGERAEAELTAAGVHHLGPVVAGASTGSCAVLVGPDGERTMLPDRGANDRLDPAVVAAAATTSTVGWVHLSGYTILHEGSRSAGEAVLAAARSQGATVSVDAASAAPIGAFGPGPFLEAIAGVALLFANDDEIAALGGVGEVLGHVGAVVVKHGPDGATWSDGRRSIRAEGVRVEAVDSTGAGDAFAAGWIAAAVAGAAAEVALADAVRVGADAVTRLGARPNGLPAAVTGGPQR